MVQVKRDTNFLLHPISTPVTAAPSEKVCTMKCIFSTGTDEYSKIARENRRLESDKFIGNHKNKK